MFNWRIRPNPEPVQEPEAKSYEVDLVYTDGSTCTWPSVERVWVFEGGLVSVLSTSGQNTLIPVRIIEQIEMKPTTGAPDETE